MIQPEIQANPIANLQYAMSLQVALLGHYDEMLHSLIESNSALLKQVSVLTLSDLSTGLAPSVSSPPTAATAIPPLAVAASAVAVRDFLYRFPNVPYSGDTGACQAFLVQCSLLFQLQPHSYSFEHSRIAYCT